MFSSRRDEVRRQIRVCPPAARMTASAWIDVAGAVGQVEAVGAEDDVVADQQPGDVDGVHDRDVRAARPVDQRALDSRPV